MADNNGKLNSPLEGIRVLDLGRYQAGAALRPDVRANGR